MGGGQDSKERARQVFSMGDGKPVYESRWAPAARKTEFMLAQCGRCQCEYIPRLAKRKRDMECD